MSIILGEYVLQFRPLFCYDSFKGRFFRSRINNFSDPFWKNGPTPEKLSKNQFSVILSNKIEQDEACEEKSSEFTFRKWSRLLP